jgi:hypothetical protein
MTTLQRAFLAVLLVGSLSLAVPVSAQTTDPRIAALLAQIQVLQAQIAAMKGGVTAFFTADLSVGSRGADVTRLQSFLIEHGNAIPAGATGYFGEQTRMALAAFQGANNISPAAGYFGNITRAKVNAMITAATPTPPPDEDDDDDRNDEDRARDALNDLEDTIADAQDDIDEAEDDGTNVDEANELLDEARDLLEDAQDEFDDEDFDQVLDTVEDAEDRVDDALDEADVDRDDDQDDGPDASDDPDTSAKTTVVSGSNNDYATFEVEVTLTAFGDDIFLSRNGDTAFTYRIENASNGSEVGSGTSQTAVISSSADTVGNYYRINEGDEETFTITVTYDPLPADEGESLRLQLLTLEYDTSASPPSSTWHANPANDYETPATYIND